MPGVNWQDPNELAGLLSVFACPTRLAILRILRKKRSVHGFELVGPIGLSQPTISHHLLALEAGGLVVRDHNPVDKRMRTYLLAPGVGKMLTQIERFAETVNLPE